MGRGIDGLTLFGKKKAGRDRILAYLEKRRKPAIEKYEQFVEDGVFWC
jgi:hypothetical protein